MGHKRTLGWCLLMFGQFRLDHAPSLLQGFHLPFRRGDDLLRERCEQRLKPLVSGDRKHPFGGVLIPIPLSQFDFASVLICPDWQRTFIPEEMHATP